jgi:2-methylcitrate dehydratase PrpD
MVLKLGTTKVLADYAVGLKYEDIPGEVVGEARKVMLHALRVGLASNATDLGVRYIDLAKEMGVGKGESTIIGEGSKVSTLAAAFANGCLCDILDWEDCQLQGHSSAVAIPAALAVGERVGASGKDVIAAIVAAYDVTDRIESALLPYYTEKELEKRCFVISQTKHFVSAVAAGKLLNLDKAHMATCIGLAGAYAHPLSCHKYMETRSHVYKGLHGWACMGGVFAALQAQRGIDGMHTILDGDKGWHAMMGYEKWDVDEMTRNLGKDYRIMRNILKRWPNDIHIQSYLDAVATIVEKHGIGPKDVEQVNINNSVDYFSYKLVPRGLFEAEFNIAYAVALVIMGIPPGPDWYTKDKYEDPVRLDLARRVKVGQVMAMWKVYEDYKWKGKWIPVTVEIVTKDGRRFSESPEYPLGHWKNPQSWDFVKGQFRSAASYVLDREKTEKSIQMIEKLEDIDNITELTEVLHK